MGQRSTKTAVTSETAAVAHLVVGLLGHNGRVGSAILNELASHNGKHLTIVVLHRPSSDISAVPKGIETRSIDLDKPDGEDFDKAVAGLHILASGVSGTGIPAQSALAPALSRNKDFITFFPSDYGAPWTEEDFKDAKLDFLKVKYKVLEEYKKAGVATTSIKTGHFLELHFQNGQSGIDAKKNIVNVYKKSQTTTKPVVSLPYIAAAFHELLKTPHKLANKQFHFTEIETTHQEITDILTKVHGKEPDLLQWDEEKIHKALNDDVPWTALGAALLRKSGEGGWKFPGDRVEVPGWKGKTIEEWTTESAQK